MSSFTGFAIAAAQLGLQSILIRPSRGIRGIQLTDGSYLEPIEAQAVIEEQHHDQLEITQHPVEQGASVADHAFRRPAEVILTLGWSNSPSSNGSLVNAALGAAAAVSPLAKQAIGAFNTVQAVQSVLSGSEPDQIAAIYQRLLHLQETRALFTIDTGKRTYYDMLCKELSTSTDYKTANSLIVKMTCQQVILVKSQTVTLPKETQKDAPATASTVNKGGINLIPASTVVNGKFGG